MTSLTRGPLPPGTYWRRRAALLLTVVVLAVAVVGTLRGGGDDPGGGGVTATTAGGTPTPAPTTPTEPVVPTPTEGSDGSGQTESTPTREPLAEPVGRCDDADVLVEPEAVDAVAGSTVTLALAVRTQETEACTWRMSARHLAVTLTRPGAGQDEQGEEVWSTRQCPGTVAQQDVVVRREVASTVTLAWDGRYSDRGCTVQRQYVEPGDLQVAAAAYGGQPTVADLELRSPSEASEAAGGAGGATDGPTDDRTGGPTDGPTSDPTDLPTDRATSVPQT